jgi:SAM-dependent methyltransferase
LSAPSSWDARAEAYDLLCQRYEIFSLLSNRLIDLLPEDLRGTVLDIGAGSGLTSAILLDRYPCCNSILVEPSNAMLDIARRKLAGRQVQFHEARFDDFPVRGVRAVAAVASASMQFVDFDLAFTKLAQVIEPGGHVAFNLWWHHWEETVGRNCMAGSRSVVEAACLDAQLSPPPDTPPQKPKTRIELSSASRNHGFELLAEHCDEYPTPVGFGVDFEAMATDWPVKGCAQEERAALLGKMRELARGKFDNLVSTRFLLQRASRV